MLWMGVHLPALSLESFAATLAPLPRAAGEEDEALDAGDDERDPLGPVALVALWWVVVAVAGRWSGRQVVAANRSSNA